MTCAVTVRSSISSSLTRCSTSASTECGTAPGEAKSKRKRPGEFSEPAWVAVSPSSSRNAWCTMCVAVCAREIAATARDVDLAPRLGAEHDLAVADDRPVHDQVADRLLHVHDLGQRAVAEPIRPWSASWPPPSA